MKKRTFISTLCFFLLSANTYAQIPPNAFNYSAVARNAAGEPIATTTIGIQISILKTSPVGISQYSENHFVNTDAFGLFNLVIGAGAVQSGSMATIDWSNDNYYLKVGMDATGGTNFLTMGTTQLLSVPYALYAKSAGTVSGGTGITITSVSLTGDTLYLSNGQTFVSSGTGNLILPTIITNSVSDITSNSATFGGEISNANGNQIMERGIVYSTTPNPTIQSSKISIGNGIGTFDTISGLGYQYAHLLSPNTTYYVRAYATTENNLTAYGNEVSFTTLSVGQSGPGGGIVFFNKGNTTGGWQYLEVAPNDIVGVFICSDIQWNCQGSYGTQLTVGSGENNTSLLLSTGCTGGGASYYASELSDVWTFGGQSDWFLPSRDELNLMYKNVYPLIPGYFSSAAIYWSSSQDDVVNRAWDYDIETGTANNPIFNNLVTRCVRAARAF